MLALPNLNIGSALDYLYEKLVVSLPILLEHTVGWFVAISIPLSLFFLIGIIYSVEQLKIIRRKEAELYDDKKIEPAYESVSADPNSALMARHWESVKKHMNAGNPNDWRQAILEADIMLDNMLSTIGYRGESVGEKLKHIEASDFDTLNEAWEAHKVRNQIAHSGSNFDLNEHEAKRIIALYKKVFEEFYAI